MTAFAGDHHIRDEIVKLRDKFKIDYAIETGTYYGETALELIKLFPSVITIEVDKALYEAFADVINGQAVVICGNSADVLKGMADKGQVDNPVFFYLDAHWESFNPLLEEIRQAGRITKFPVIAIHDFKVPAGFGYDTYNGQPYTLEWITPALNECYPGGFGYHYNEVAAGSMRGIIYIYPI
jgi:hypothetical protein